MAYVWNEKTGKFEDAETGAPLAESALRKIVDDFALALLLLFTTRARRVLTTLVEIETNEADFFEALRDWNFELRQQIQAGNLAAAALAFGGLKNASPSNLEIAENFADQQMRFFENFAAAVFSGALILNGIFAARSGMYGSAVYSSFENARRERERQRGMNEERRILGAADHCPICLSENAKGWVAIGTLRAIGDSECRSRCRCWFSYRKTENSSIVVL